MDMKAKIFTGILNLFKFPVLKSKPKMGKWYGIPLEGCVSADGVPARASFRKGSENKLIVLFFSIPNKKMPFQTICIMKEFYLLSSEKLISMLIKLSILIQIIF